MSPMSSALWVRFALLLWAAIVIWVVVDPSKEAIRSTLRAGAVTASLWALAFKFRPLLEAALQYAYLAGERARSDEDA